MVAFERILVATDFGPSSERAVAVAVALADRLHAGLTLLHVWEAPSFTYGGMLYSAADVLEPVRDKAQAALDEAVAKLKPSCPTVTGALRCGDPRVEVLGAIDASRPDLVVMGTHGRKGLARAFLGSVAERVVRDSTVPVLTVHGADTP